MTTKIKIITSGFVSLFFLVLDWVLINSALFGDKPLLFWIWPGLVTSISIAFLTLFGLVNNNRWITYGFGALALVTYLLDRKTTRLNSSHSQISYPAFC